MDEQEKRSLRRLRYRGTHPRKFAEKYKELQPGKYALEVKKVEARGQTPAGMHRPICVAEILEVLAPRPGETGLDATVGYGGHAGHLLARMEGRGKLWALDSDPIELPKTELRLRNLGFPAEVLQFRRMNFAGIAKLLGEVPNGFDFILADLGVSSMQLDDPARGFTFKSDGPLDLRMNPQRGQPAAEWLRACGEAELAELLWENADEPYGREIARAVAGAEESPQTTRKLAVLIATALAALPRSVPEAVVKKSIARTFQALRIAINDEFGALERFLDQLPYCLKPGGRVAILTFHSGEDRRVKRAFKQGFADGIYRQIAPEPLRPSRQEQFENPRSSSAKLRWAYRL